MIMLLRLSFIILRILLRPATPGRIGYREGNGTPECARLGPSGRESSPNPAWSPLVLRLCFLRMDRFCLRDEVAAARGVSILRKGFCLGDGVNLCGLLRGPTWPTASVNGCCRLGILGFPSNLFLILRKVGGSGVINGI
jgi:hypothetical protein